MQTKGFIGSFALSALLVSAAGALLVVMGALLAFDGFPGPNLEDSTKLMRVAGVAAGERTKPQLVLDPPTARALEPGSGPASLAGAGSTDAAVPTTASPLDTATADSAPTFAPPADDPQSGTAPAPPAPVDGAVPDLPSDDGGSSGGPTSVVDSTVDRVAPVTDGVRDTLDGVGDRTGLGLP
jgi:hypothetical protein